MIGIDTNIVIRLLTRDDKVQYRLALELVKSVRGRRLLVINPIVVAETIWVLERSYRLDRQRSRPLLEQLVHSIEFTIPTQMSCESWQSWFSATHRDFSDAMIAAINRDSGCSKTLTFDEDAAKAIPSTELLT